MGTGGGRFGFRRRTLRRVVVALLLVWASMIGGAAPHTVSATRMAILIFRENIYPFFNCDCRLCERSRFGWRERCHCPSVKNLSVDLLFAWNIPVEKVISPHGTRVLPHQENEWLSGTTISCAKA
jgi:hypothetical protein